MRTVEPDEKTHQAYLPFYENYKQAYTVMRDLRRDMDRT